MENLSYFKKIQKAYNSGNDEEGTKYLQEAVDSVCSKINALRDDFNEQDFTILVASLQILTDAWTAELSEEEKELVRLLKGTMTAYRIQMILPGSQFEGTEE